jgi:hypothetical protein
VGLVDDQPEPFFEGDAEREFLVLVIKRLQHRGGTRLAELSRPGSISVPLTWHHVRSILRRARTAGFGRYIP